jgi:hypothetical protein
MREDLNQLLADLRQMSRQGDPDATEAVDYIENLAYSGRLDIYASNLADTFVWAYTPQGHDFWMFLRIRHQEYLRRQL